MFAHFMSDHGYVTYYLRVDLLDGTYSSKTEYQEDLEHGSSLDTWRDSGILTVPQINTLFTRGKLEDDSNIYELNLIC